MRLTLHHAGVPAKTCSTPHPGACWHGERGTQGRRGTGRLKRILKKLRRIAAGVDCEEQHHLAVPRARALENPVLGCYSGRNPAPVLWINRRIIRNHSKGTGTLPAQRQWHRARVKGTGTQFRVRLNKKRGQLAKQLILCFAKRAPSEEAVILD